MKTAKNIFYGLLMALVISGCKQNVKNALIKKVDQQCGDHPKSNCIITLKDATSFNWEKMYVFYNWTTSDSISKAMGFNYRGDDVEDQYWRMVFVNENAVVYEENNEDLDYYNPSIEFEGTESPTFGKAYSITSGQAIFTVDKGKMEGACTRCFVYSFRMIKK